MYDIDSSLDRQILSFQKNKPAMVLTEPLDARVIEAACYLPRFAHPVFLAREEDVKAVITNELGHIDPTRLEFALSESAFIDIEQRTDLIEEFARACVELPEAIAWCSNMDDARRTVAQPARFESVGNSHVPEKDVGG